MDILLISIDEVDPKVIDTLNFDLTRVFKKRVLIGKRMTQPDDALNKKRNQRYITIFLQ